MIRPILLLACAVVAAAPLAAEAQPWRPGASRFEQRFGERVTQTRSGGWRGQEAGAADGVRQGRLVPLNRIIESIRRQTPGRLLDAGLEGGERPVYRVRWAADDGRRIDFIVDAATGQIISAE